MATPEVKTDAPKTEVKPEAPKPEIKTEAPKSEVKPETPKFEINVPKTEVKSEIPKPDEQTIGKKREGNNMTESETQKRKIEPLDIEAMLAKMLKPIQDQLQSVTANQEEIRRDTNIIRNNEIVDKYRTIAPTLATAYPDHVEALKSLEAMGLERMKALNDTSILRFLTAVTTTKSKYPEMPPQFSFKNGIVPDKPKTTNAEISSEEIFQKTGIKL